MPRPPGPTPLLPSLAGPLTHQGGGAPLARPGGGWAGLIDTPPLPRQQRKSLLRKEEVVSDELRVGRKHIFDATAIFGKLLESSFYIIAQKSNHSKDLLISDCTVKKFINCNV